MWKLVERRGALRRRGCLSHPNFSRISVWSSRLDPVNQYSPSSISLDRLSYLKNDAARNPTALWNLLQFFRRPSLPDPIYIENQKLKVNFTWTANPPARSNPSPFSTQGLPQIVREMYKRPLVYYSFLTQKWFGENLSFRIAFEWKPGRT